MALNGITLCCLTEKCQRMLNNGDSLQQHINHKIVTSQQIFEAYQTQKNNLVKELKDGFYIKQLSNLQKKQQETLQEFVKNTQLQITEFQQHIISQTQILLDHLSQIKLNEVIENDVVTNYYDIQEDKFDDSDLNRLIKLIKNTSTFNERQLKDGMNDNQGVGQGIHINFNMKLNLLKPQEYYHQIYDQVRSKYSTIQFIQQQLEQLKCDFLNKMHSWSSIVNQLYDEQTQFTVMKTNQQKNSRGIGKIELQHVFQDLMVYSFQNQVQFCLIDHMKSCSTLKLKLIVSDFTIDTEKRIISIIQGNELFLFNILDRRRIRKFPISIDLSKGVALKFFENQVCVSSGVSLEFFPVHPTSQLNKFSQSLNFHSYWDRINIVDYYVVNRFGNQDMLLMVGTIGGLVSLFNSHFKEMHSKQIHQGAVNQFRFKQSQQFGKILITTGDDMRVNICTIENNSLKCIQMLAFQSQVINLMIFKTCFFVTTKNQNSLELYQINEKDECIRQTINGDIRLEAKDQILNIGKKIIIIRNQIIGCRML